MGLFGKETIRTSRCKTQYLANISPYLWQLFLYLLTRVRPASIRHNFPRQGNILPIKTTNSVASRNRIDTLRLEDEQSTFNLWPLFNRSVVYVLCFIIYMDYINRSTKYFIQRP